MSNIYDKLKEVMKENEIDHHCSDLYCKVTSESKAIIDTYEFKKQVSTFKDNLTGSKWYDIPFAYYPYFEVKEPECIEVRR